MNVNPHTLDADLIRHLQHRTAESDEKAFEQLYLLHKDRVYEIAFTYTESPILSEEILQDIFVQVWMKRSELATIEDFRSWLFIMTRNRSFNVLRGIARAETRDREMVHYLPGTSPTADHRLLNADLENLLREAMQLLTPAQLKAFQLFKLQGLSREETAAAMGISPNTAKIHVMQAMRTIRAYLVGRNVLLPATLSTALYFF